MKPETIQPFRFAACSDPAPCDYSDAHVLVPLTAVRQLITEFDADQATHKALKDLLQQPEHSQEFNCPPKGQAAPEYKDPQCDIPLGRNTQIKSIGKILYSLFIKDEVELFKSWYELSEERRQWYENVAHDFIQSLKSPGQIKFEELMPTGSWASVDKITHDSLEQFATQFNVHKKQADASVLNSINHCTIHKSSYAVTPWPDAGPETTRITPTLGCPLCLRDILVDKTFKAEALKIQRDELVSVLKTLQKY